MDLSRNARRVQAALAERGIEARVVELPASTRTAAEAAQAIGCTVAQIAKSIVFRRADTGEPVLVVASGAQRIDEGMVARVVGAPVGKADADWIRERLGFAVGGVPPLGHLEPVPTLVDPGLLAFEKVWAAGGTPHAVFEIAPRVLASLPGVSVSEVAT